MQQQHTLIDPAILYWGTPVVIISTTNEDSTANLCPMSSAWWLGDRCMLGLLACSQTTINLLRNGQCVLNLPSDDMSRHVNALARTTGSEVVPELKRKLGYVHVKDKFGAAELTPEQHSEAGTSTAVPPPRVRECPVQMEAELVAVHKMGGPGPTSGMILAIEVRVRRVYVTDELRMNGHENRIDPDKWRPMVMSFQQLYGLSRGMMDDSKLAEIDEDMYRR